MLSRSARRIAAALAGGEALVVAGYVDQGGSGIVRGALDSGAFNTFVFTDGMVTQALVDKFGTELEHSFGQNPSAEGEGRADGRLDGPLHRLTEFDAHDQGEHATQTQRAARGAHLDDLLGDLSGRRVGQFDDHREAS